MNILISACLLGVDCRYDASAKTIPELENLMSKHTLIPVCPEQLGGLSTPRSPAEIKGDLVINKDGVDVTEEFAKGAEETLKIAKLYNCEYAILKERSPSCGSKKVYDGTFSKTIIDGDGFAAKLLKENGIKVIGETEINLGMNYNYNIKRCMRYENKMKIDFYYWSYQCPINSETLELLDEYKDRFDISTYNIEENFELAKKQRMFFPFLTVVNGKERYKAPINKKLLDKILNGEMHIEKPHVIDFGNKKYKGDIVPLTKDNISSVSKKCTITNCCDSCDKKAIFLSKYCDDIFGYLNTEDGKIIGGVEYIPTNYVPYDIPKSKDYAFITCLYHSSTEYDYKHHPFIELEKYLKNKYKKIYAITDEVGTFPNGDLKWFLEHGFVDEGIVANEENYCNLHLVCKSI